MLIIFNKRLNLNQVIFLYNFNFVMSLVSTDSDGIFKNKYIRIKDKFVINNFVIPDDKMPEHPFDDNSRINIIRLTIPNTVKSIKPYSFDDYVNLTSLNYFASTDIPDFCFNNCGKLSSVHINNEKCKEIGMGAFRKCTNLKDVIISNDVKYIKKGAFEFTDNLKYVMILSKLISIEDEAFKNSGIEKIIIPDSVEWLGKNIFIYCHKLNKITISNYLYGKYQVNNAFDFKYLGLYNQDWIVEYDDTQNNYHMYKKSLNKENKVEYHI